MHSVTGCSEGYSDGNSGVNAYLLTTTKEIKTYKDFFLNSLSGKFTFGHKLVANK